ncbi:MAG: polysaccharide biosynthesis/export family protein, partial [Planctomycetota bacterium]
MRDYRTLLLLLLVGGILLPVAVSLAQEGEAPVISDEYLLVVGDQIKIIVEGQGEERDYVVPVEGEVAFPPIGRITLIDKSVKTISEEIRQKLKDKAIYTNPVVHVLMIAYAPREAYLWGAATGAIPLLPHKKLTLLQVLSKARIQPTVADFRDIKVIRMGKNGKKFTIPVNLQDVVAKNRYESDIIVMPDDTIIIPSFEDRTMMSYVYILGKVNKPGRYG